MNNQAHACKLVSKIHVCALGPAEERGLAQHITERHPVDLPGDMQVEQAQFAHLCTVMSNMHHRRAGYPFGTLVDFAVDEAGYPIFCLSPLAIHTRNIMEDPRCSLVVQMPGWTGSSKCKSDNLWRRVPAPPASAGDS